jgi:hypothetical protein
MYIYHIYSLLLAVGMYLSLCAFCSFKKGRALPDMQYDRSQVIFVCDRNMQGGKALP